VTTPDPAALPGAAVKLTVPGPESTTLEIVTDSVTNDGSPGECTAVVVKEPQGHTSHLLSGCGGPAAAVPVAAIVEWQAASGVSYAIVSGPAPVGATKVALSSRSGVTGATGPTGGGYYLLYVPAQEMPEQGVLNFYNSSSQVIESQQIASQSSPSP
jgi:hypothetical protein